MAEKTIFKKIIDKEIPANVVYEDDLCLAFYDVSEDNADLIGHIFCVIKKLAADLGIAENGYRVVSNCGPCACQTVPHLHFHLIGGRAFSWPPG